MKKQNPEAEEQKKLIKEYRKGQASGRYLMHYNLFLNESERKRTIAQQRWFTAMGGIAGIPDLFLAVVKTYAGLYIEMKAPRYKPKTTKSKGGLSDYQIHRIAQLRESGYKVAICYSAEEAINEINIYLGV